MKVVALSVVAAAVLLAQIISPPRGLHRVDPEYTREGLEAKVSGTVVLSTMIGADGIPGEIKVVRGLGKGLDEKAVECLQKWRFTPGLRDGEPVAVRATVEIRFRLPLPSPGVV